jgi:hypothetical protein
MVSYGRSEINLGSLESLKQQMKSLKRRVESMETALSKFEVLIEEKSK